MGQEQEDDSFQRFQNAPQVDFEKLGKTVVIDDTRKGRIDLDMDHQDEIVHAALTAVQNINLPYGAVHAGKYNEGKEIIISNSTDAIIKGGSSRLFLEDQNVVLDNAQTHSISARIDILPQEDGTLRVNLRAQHEGAYDENVLDASSAIIGYTFDAKGNLTARNGNAITEDHSTSVTQQEHGKWTIQAVQALESNFAIALGGDVQEQINKLRPQNAATKADAPPIADDAGLLSKINLKSLTDDAKPAADTPAALPQLKN